MVSSSLGPAYSSTRVFRPFRTLNGMSFLVHSQSIKWDNNTLRNVSIDMIPDQASEAVDLESLV